MAETGRYLYAICRDLPAGALEGVRGLDESPLEVVTHRGLVAVVSDVDLAEYDEEGLKVHLEQLDWLERVARRHDEVIRAVSAAAPTAPLRLATICLDDDGVRRRLDEWGPALEQVLDRITGRKEWSVKVLTRPREEPTAEVAAPTSGADYLRAKKAAATSRLMEQDEAAAVADEVHASLAAESVASRRLPPQDPRLTGHTGTMVLNGAYLVAEHDGERFAERVRALAAAHPGVSIESAGPWAPYSFAMLEQR